MQAWDCNSSLSIVVDGERNREGGLALQLSEADRSTFTGNQQVSTSTAALRKLNPAITEMLFIFPSAGAKPCARQP